MQSDDTTASGSGKLFDPTEGSIWRTWFQPKDPAEMSLWERLEFVDWINEVCPPRAPGAAPSPPILYAVAHSEAGAAEIQERWAATRRDRDKAALRKRLRGR